jgi:peptidyl-prolyl cis-trans isomerase SurA
LATVKDNRVKSLLLGLLLALAVPLAAASTQTLDRVVAIVDDDIILASELEERLAQVRENIQRAGQTMPEEQLRREVLDMMILESLQLQMAERAGLRISDEQLNSAMARIASQNNMSLPEFRRALEMSGHSYEMAREQIRHEMMMQQVQRGSVSQRIQITPQEVDNFLASEEGRQYISPEYRLAHLLVPVPSDAGSNTIAHAERRAEELARELRQGADIDSLRVGDIQGGDLGWAQDRTAAHPVYRAARGAGQGRGIRAAAQRQRLSRGENGG